MNKMSSNKTFTVHLIKLIDISFCLQKTSNNVDGSFGAGLQKWRSSKLKTKSHNLTFYTLWIIQLHSINVRTRSFIN